MARKSSARSNVSAESVVAPEVVHQGQAENPGSAPTDSAVPVLPSPEGKSLTEQAKDLADLKAGKYRRI
jgi:hypothetical protein